MLSLTRSLSFVCGGCLCAWRGRVIIIMAVFDNLPAVLDHDANPDPGLAAVLVAPVSHRPGKFFFWLTEQTRDRGEA